MRDFRKKAGIRKRDEMERNILLKAQRNALIYVKSVFLIWSLHEFYKCYTQSASFSLVPIFILCTTLMVEGFFQFFYQKKAVEGDDEYQEPSAARDMIGILFMAIIIAVIVIGIIVAAFGTWGKV